MTYGYIRVSTDRQITDNQRFEIERFCKKNSTKIDEWIEETISGTKDPKKRKLGGLLEKVVAGDLIICSEISRLGRKLFMIMLILQTLLDKNVKVWTIKDNYRLGDDIQSKILAFAFGIAAEIERDMISQRTKEALKVKVSKGRILGHPKGKTHKSKLDYQKEEIIKLLKEGMNVSEISRIVNVHRLTLVNYLKLNDLHKYRQDPYAAVSRRKYKVSISQLKKYIKDGLTIVEMAKKIGVHQTGFTIYFRTEYKELYKQYQEHHIALREKYNKDSNSNRRRRGEM